MNSSYIIFNSDIFEDNSALYVDIKATGVLKSLYGNKETKYNVICRDHGGCGCWFIQQVI